MNNELRQYLEKREKEYGSTPSMALMEKWVSEFMIKHNNSPVDIFEGYSPLQMSKIIYGLWKDDSIVKIKNLDPEDFDRIPILKQGQYLCDILLKEEKIRLTKTKALPPKIAKELYAIGVPEFIIEKGITKLTKETDCESAQYIHILLVISGIAKERLGIMTLTKKGKEIIKDPQIFLQTLLIYATLKFNIAFFDGYENDTIGMVNIGFTFVLLAKYGSTKRSYTFYANKYFTAFPTLLNDMKKSAFDNEDFNREKRGAACYSVRVFQRTLVHFGLVEVEGDHILRDDEFITKTPLYDKMIEVTPP